MFARLRFLARLARRNAVRHRGQTIRAIAGLLVATIVLATALGLGSSVSNSFYDVATAQYGPIDVTVKSQVPFDQAMADNIPAQVEGLAGAGTLVLEGIVTNQRTGLAHQDAVVRGVSAPEANAFGAIPVASGPIAEPGPGEAVLSQRLATTLEARIGDALSLRLPQATTTEVQVLDESGLTGSTPSSHTLQIDAPATVWARVQRETVAGAMTVSLRAPDGTETRDETATADLVVTLAGQAGQWTVTVESMVPTNYSVAAGMQEAGQEFVGASLRVTGIAKQEGRAAIAGSHAALVSLGTLQGQSGLDGKVNAGYYRADGDPREAADSIRSVLSSSENAFSVKAAKADALNNARQFGVGFTAGVIGMSGFTLVAASLLAYTLFSSLVAARRAEIGVSRAMGMTQREVAWTLILEGVIYAFAAALVGTALGFLLVWGSIQYIGDALAAETGGISGIGVHFTWRIAAWSVLVGTLFPLVTIGLGSRRFARMDPARSIHGVPEDPRARRRAAYGWSIILAVLGLLLTLTVVGHVMGVPLLLGAVAVFLWARGRQGIAIGVVAAGVAYTVWSLYAFNSFDSELGVLLIFGRGALLAVGLAALAVASKRPYDAILQATTQGGMRRSMFIGVRYLVARRGPVGLTMAMVALVTVMVAVLGTILLSVAALGDDPDVGGYQVLAHAPGRHTQFPEALPDAVAVSLDRADFLPHHEQIQAPRYLRDGAEVPVADGQMDRFIGTTPAFAAGQQFELDRRADDYATDEDAWNAVVSGDAMIVPTYALENQRLRLDEQITLETSNFRASYHIAGSFVPKAIDWQAFVSASDVQAMGYPADTIVFIRVAEGDDPTRVARILTATYAEQGFSFTSLPEEAQQAAAQQEAIGLVVQAFLALGLFVGLAATGFLAGRAVRERMREIGTLRALGYEESDIRRSFMVESLLTAGVGLLIGLVAGILVAHSLWWQTLRDLTTFQPPWLLLSIMAATVLLVSALAARGPARRAAKLAPAMAVRHVD